MGLDKRLLDILCCPLTKQPVQMLSARQLQVLQQAQSDGTLRLADGSTAASAPQAGLLTCDGKSIYLIDDGIPVMLADQAVPTSQFSNFPV